MSLTKVSYSMINGISINVFDYMTASQILDVQARTVSLDVSAAVQAAIEYSASKQGIEIYFPSGSYRIDTPLNLTSDVSANRSFTRLVGDGMGTIIQANTGGRLFDCVGSNFLTFKHFYVTASSATPSNIIWQFARGAVNNYCQYNRIEDVWLQLPSRHTENGGYGTIGILNVEGEDHTYTNFMCSANSPAVLLRFGGPLSLGIPLVSYAALATSGTSFGHTTFAASTQLEALNAWKSSLYIDGVNTLTMQNVHLTNGIRNGDTTGSAVYAITTGNSAPILKSNIFGLVEEFPRFMITGNTIQDSVFEVLVAGTGLLVDQPLVDIGANSLIETSINVTHGDSVRRTLVTGVGNAGTIQNSTLTGFNTSVNLPAALTYKAKNTVYTNDYRVTSFGEKTQDASVIISQISINPVSNAVQIQLPIASAGISSGIINFTLMGVISTLNVNTQIVPPSFATFTHTLNLVSTVNGTWVSSIPVTVLDTPIGGDPAKALISALTITPSISVGGVLTFAFLGAATGTNSLDNGIWLTECKVTAVSSGFSQSTGIVI